MTFNAIEERWKVAAIQGPRRDLWDDLCGAPQGWLKACQAAVSAQDTVTITHWLEATSRVATAPKGEASADSKAACLTFARGYGIDVTVLHAYLLCAQGMLQTGRSGTTTLVPVSALEGLVEDLAARMPTLRWPRNQWQDMVQSVHPGWLRAPTPQATTIAVLLAHLDSQQRPTGVRASLTLQLRPLGTGTLYPGFPTAFITCDEKFRTAAQDVRTCLQNAGVWPVAFDVCWQLTDLIGAARPIFSLEGGSLGAALALGLAKLFAATASPYFEADTHASLIS